MVHITEGGFYMRIKPFNKLDSVFAIQDLLNKTMDVTSTLEPDAKISLDLRGLKYITPIGYTGLLSILEFLEKEYNVKVKVPNDDRPVKYMQRMNFLRFVVKISNPNLMIRCIWSQFIIETGTI